jgi:hypothetical protein
MDALVSKLFFPETNRYVFFIIFLLTHIITGEKWSRSTWLDGHNHKFHLSWNFNDQSEKITFLVEVQTKGWVGFGISKNGRMSNSDVVIGWVTDDNETFFHVSLEYFFSIFNQIEVFMLKIKEFSKEETQFFFNEKF